MYYLSSRTNENFLKTEQLSTNLTEEQILNLRKKVELLILTA